LRGAADHRDKPARVAAAHGQGLFPLRRKPHCCAALLRQPLGQRLAGPGPVGKGNIQGHTMASSVLLGAARCCSVLLGARSLAQESTTGRRSATNHRNRRSPQPGMRPDP